MRSFVAKNQNSLQFSWSCCVLEQFILGLWRELMNYFKCIPFGPKVATGIPVIHSKVNFRIQGDMGWTWNHGHNCNNVLIIAHSRNKWTKWEKSRKWDTVMIISLNVGSGNKFEKKTFVSVAYVIKFIVFWEMQKLFTKVSSQVVNSVYKCISNCS